MADLLSSVIAAHGGLDRWRAVRAIDVTFNFSAHGELFHHAAEHAVCAADHLPRLQSRRTPPVPGAVRPPCLGLPVRLRTVALMDNAELEKRLTLLQDIEAIKRLKA